MEKKYTVLMTTMGLDIGGAETHIVELAKELHKAGHRILVASNGGVYEKELTEAGIRHFRVPMNKRNLKMMARALGMLEKIIREEKVEIVHSKYLGNKGQLITEMARENDALVAINGGGFYDPEGKSLIFKSLSELKSLFNLDKEDVKQCFLQRVYTTKDGIGVLHYF